MSQDWRVDPHPLVMCGTTQAGKTTMLRALHFLWPGSCSIVFDLDEEPDLGVEVESVPELNQAIANGADQVVVRTPADVVRSPELFEDVVRYLMKLGNANRASSSPHRVQFIMDELQDLDEDWVQIAQKRLAKRNVKPVAASQDPVSVPKRCRTISRWNSWLSPPEGQMHDSLDAMPYPLDQLQALDDYDMIVYDEDWEPVGRFRAPERFVVE